MLEYGVLVHDEKNNSILNIPPELKCKDKEVPIAFLLCSALTGYTFGLAM